MRAALTRCGADASPLPRQKPPSRLERRFLLYWQSLGGPVLEREYRFHPTRKWRADFAHVESRTLIKVEGGIYIAGGGRHHRAAGFVADLKKYLEAALAGWRVVRLAEPLIIAPMVERLIAFVRGGGVQPYTSGSPECRLQKAIR